MRCLRETWLICRSFSWMMKSVRKGKVDWGTDLGSTGLKAVCCICSCFSCFFLHYLSFSLPTDVKTNTCVLKNVIYYLVAESCIRNEVTWTLNWLFLFLSFIANVQVEIRENIGKPKLSEIFLQTRRFFCLGWKSYVFLTISLMNSESHRYIY